MMNEKKIVLNLNSSIAYTLPHLEKINHNFIVAHITAIKIVNRNSKLKLNESQCLFFIKLYFLTIGILH